MEILPFSLQACSDRIEHSQRWNEYNTSRSCSLSHSAYLCFILPADWHERWHQILSETDVCLAHRKHRSFSHNPLISAEGQVWTGRRDLASDWETSWRFECWEAPKWNDKTTKVSETAVLFTYFPVYFVCTIKVCEKEVREHKKKQSSWSVSTVSSDLPG